MGHLQGGKITSTHTTAIDLAVSIVSFLEPKSEITKISLGYIKTFNNRTSNDRVVKIIDDTNCILVVVTQKGSVQEIYVYSSNRQSTKLELARFTRNNKWQLRFGLTS